MKIWSQCHSEVSRNLPNECCDWVNWAGERWCFEQRLWAKGWPHLSLLCLLKEMSSRRRGTVQQLRLDCCLSDVNNYWSNMAAAFQDRKRQFWTFEYQLTLWVCYQGQCALKWHFLTLQVAHLKYQVFGSSKRTGPYWSLCKLFR